MDYIVLKKNRIMKRINIYLMILGIGEMEEEKGDKK